MIVGEQEQEQEERDSRIAAKDGGGTHRPRLMSKLTAALDEPSNVTLVLAPAGTGKTLLLEQWGRDSVGRYGAALVWVAWEADQDDLGPVLSGLLKTADAALQAELDGVAGVDSAAGARALARAVGAWGRRVIIVLDDVHHVVSAEAGQLVASFLRALPDNAHLVLAGRDAGAIPLARTRITGLALELGGRDLAFTADEVRSYLVGRGVRCSQGEISSILVRTEGWAAGLRLMELTALGEPSAVERTLRGDAPVAADYFLEELFANLDEDLQNFLVLTSVVDEFTVELAGALTSRETRASAIQDLSHLSILFGSDAGGRWYRYHPLLREFLRGMLQEREPSLVETLTCTAVQWCVANDEHLSALELAGRIGDTALRAAVVRRCGLQLVLTGEVDAAVDAIGRMPLSVQSDLAVQMLVATAELARGDEAPAAILSALDPDLPLDEATSCRRWLAALGLQVAVRRGGIIAALSRVGDEQLDVTEDAQLDTYILVNAAMAELYVGHLGRADELARRAIDRARAAGFSAAELKASAILITEALFSGALSRTDELIAQDDVRWRAMDRPADMYYLGTRLWAAWVRVERMQDASGADLGGDELVEAVAAIRASAERAIARGACAMMAIVAADTAQDVSVAADTILDHLAPRDDMPLPPHWFAMAGMLAVHCFDRLGQTSQRDRFIREAQAELGNAGDAAVMRAVAALHDQRFADAENALTPVLDGTRPCLLAATMIDAWLVWAALEVHRGHPERAHTALDTALRLAEPEGFIHRFAAAGPVIARLLAARATPAARGRFADAVRGALLGAGMLVEEPLTERERIVLDSLSHDATLRDIAQQEYISLNTVKTHVRNIYRKLGVSDRTQVTEAARALGLG